MGRSTGLVDVTTGGGDIELGPVMGSASASTGAGDVHIAIVDEDGGEHDVEVTSAMGHVVLELPATLEARFELETANT